MSDPDGHDTANTLVDAIVDDLSVGIRRYLGRRPHDDDSRTFVLQLGEDGRLRLPWPDPAVPGALIQTGRTTQDHLARELGDPVPRCPVHADHALHLREQAGRLEWVCPSGGWRCRVGDFAHRAWPHLPHDELAPVLGRRLRDRGIRGVHLFGVRADPDGPVATFEVAEATPAVVAALEDAAAPLRVEVWERPRLPRRRLGPVADTEPAPASLRLRLTDSQVRAGATFDFVVVNDGEAPLLIGSDYAIDHADGGWWYAVDLGLAFAAAGMIVEPGASRDLSALVPPRSDPGQYRLRKSARPRDLQAVGNPWGDPLEATARFTVTAPEPDPRAGAGAG